MPVAKLDKQQVVGALKATHSNDPDVLFARKEELLADTRRLKLLGIAPIIMGVIMTLTIIGAFVGIPVMIFGFWVRGRLKSNIRVADETYAEFIHAALPPGTQARAY
ncbi:hypothetical protein F183_A49530 [Bryobacterales bacterium F-183]|nr:hypothetical protein F183_A49530 [Bryobacterales bacterium F-183]